MTYMFAAGPSYSGASTTKSDAFVAVQRKWPVSVPRPQISRMVPLR